MREDLSVQFLYSHYDFDIDEPLGCCEITSRNTAGTTTEQECRDITEGLLPTLLTRGVEIVRFSTCPGASKKPKCTCPQKIVLFLEEKN